MAVIWKLQRKLQPQMVDEREREGERDQCLAKQLRKLTKENVDFIFMFFSPDI